MSFLDRWRARSATPPAAPPAPPATAQLGGLAAVKAVDSLATAPDPDSTLAHAFGRALAGARATCWLDGDLDGAADRLRVAAARRVPLVSHVVTNAAISHARPDGGGHDDVWTLADAGAFVLFARDGQEAVDLSLVARRAAERALVPAVVVQDRETANREESIEMPAKETVLAYLGHPEEGIVTPTPEQAVLFGETRRRVPRWLDPEAPALFGAKLDGATFPLGAAARRAYAAGPLAASLGEAFDTLRPLTGRGLGPVVGETVGASLVLVGMGTHAHVAERVAHRLRGQGIRAGWLGIRVLRPFPVDEVVERLASARDVLVLERANAWLASEPRLTAEVRAAGVGGRLISAIAGFGGAEVLEEDLLELARTFDDRTGPVWVGADFAPDLRSDPKRAAIREELGRAFPGAERHGVRADRVSDRAPGDVLVPPARARRVPENAAPWSSLPSAWDGFVRPWSEGRAAALAPDPLLALAALPAGAGALRPVANVSGQLPAFDPAACTGCGRCWVSCPHGAIEPVVTGVTGLLNEGMRLAREQGGSVDVLRSVSSKLAREVEARLAAADAPATFGDALEQAFRAIEGAVPDERRANVAAAVSAVGAAIGALEVARPEALEGSVASIVVDPDACTGCGICVAECEPAALRLEEATAESAGAMRARTDLALSLAPTDAALRERLAARDDVGVAAATWLDPHARHALGPGDAAPAGSPARLGLRLALGALSAAQAQRDVEARARVRAVRERAAESIRHAMLDVVPTGDLDAISRGLESLGGRDVDVAALVSRLEEAVETGPVNAERLARVVDRAKSVVDLDERLARATGPGRRTYVVVADRDLAEWIATFPAQPFPGPTIVDLDGAGIATASGLLDEIARETVENARAIRRVEHALTGSAAPDPQDLPARFEDLRPEEQALAPRVVLLLDDESWTQRRGGAIEALLARRLPLAVVVTAGSAGSDAGRSELALLAAAGRDAFVVQDTVADPDPLVRAIRDAATKGGPLLVRVFAPPSDGEAAAALERIRERRDAGEFVPFVSSPSAQAPLGTITLRDGIASPTRDVLLLLAGSAGPAIERARDEARDEERRRAVGERSTALDAATRDTQSALVERLERRLMALAGPDSEDDA